MEDVGEDFDPNAPSGNPELHNNNCIFFSLLPPEIRRMIYVLALNPWVEFAGERILLSRAPLYVCRRMYLEGTEAFYSEEEFRIPLSGGLAVWKQRGRRNMSFIRRVWLGNFDSAYIRRPFSDTWAPELKRLQLRRWLEDVKNHCPNARRITVDFRKGVLSKQKIERECPDGRDAVVQVLQCVYNISDYLGLQNRLDIKLKDWVFGPNVDVRKAVLNHVYNHESERFSYPRKEDHLDCTICGGLGFTKASLAAKIERPQIASLPTGLQSTLALFKPPAQRFSSCLELLPSSILQRIFVFMGNLEKSGLGAPLQNLYVRVDDKGEAKGLKTRDGWWSNKYHCYSYWFYQSELNRKTLGLRDLLHLRSVCRSFYNGVDEFFRGPFLEDIRFIFESPVGAMKFIELIRCDEGAHELGGLTFPFPRSIISLPLRHVELALWMEGDPYRPHEVGPPMTSETKNAGHWLRCMRLAVAFFLKLESIETLTLHVRPECVPFLHYLGPHLLNRLVTLAETEPCLDSTIDMAYNVPPQKCGEDTSRPTVKVLMGPIKVAKLPHYCAPVHNPPADVSWLLHASVDTPLGFDGNQWKELNGIWEKRFRDREFSRTALLIVHSDVKDMVKLDGNRWDIL